MRQASRPSTTSPNRPAPSSMSAGAVLWPSPMRSAVVDDAGGLGETVGGADHDDEVAGDEAEVGAGRRVHGAAAQDRHNRRAGAGTQGRVAERVAVERGSGYDDELVGLDAGQVAVLCRDVLHEVRRAQQAG